MKQEILFLLAFVAVAYGCGPCIVNPVATTAPPPSADLLNLINYYLPGGSPARSEILDTTFDPNILFTSAGSLTVNYLREGAGFRNTFGYFVYTVNAGVPTIVRSDLIFPDVEDACMTGKSSVTVPGFQAGDRVGFYLVADGRCSGTDTLYTIDSLNSDGFRHIAIFKDPVSGNFVVGIEDIVGLGDRDYDDVVFTFSVTGNIDDSEIPSVCVPACPLGTTCEYVRGGTECVPIPSTDPLNCGSGTAKKPFGNIASLFNVFVLGGFNCKYSDTEGRLAAGGKIDLEAYSVGCKVGGQNVSNCINFGSITCADLANDGIWADTLVGGADVFFLNGEIKTGNAVYGDEEFIYQVNLVSDCAARQDNVIDFAFEFQYLKSLSNAIRDEDVTGEIFDEHGTLHFVGTNANMEVFHIKADLLGTANGIKFDKIKPTASVLINVEGKTINAGQFGFFNVNPTHTLWNFYDATTVTLYNVGWEGSVLAVDADIVDPRGQINGQVFAKSWKGSETEVCMQLNHAPFEGCVPNPDDSTITETTPPFCVEDCVNELGGAELYNVFIKEDYSCVNSDIEGRFAAGGNVFMRNFGVANCLLLNRPSDDTCARIYNCDDLPLDGKDTYVAGGSVDGQNVGLGAGNAVYGEGESATGINLNSNGCTLRSEDDVIDFAGAFDFLETQSTNLATLANTGSVENNYFTFIFSGTGATDLEVFSISDTQLGSANGLRLIGTANKATIIFNVSGKDIIAKNFGFQNSNTWPSRYIIWNFYEAETITIQSVGWRGTILAPFAEFKDTTGQIDGQLIARKFTGPAGSACMEKHEHPFFGCIPECF